jgi:hypothetical protein
MLHRFIVFRLTLTPPTSATAARAARLVEAQLVEGKLLDRAAVAGRRAGAQDRRAQLADDAAVAPQLRTRRASRARARPQGAPVRSRWPSIAFRAFSGAAT